MSDAENLITCIARMRPLPGKTAEVLAAREQMLAEFHQLPGFESATLYAVEGNDEWRDIIVFSTQHAHDHSSDGDGYKKWSALIEFLGYEYITPVDGAAR